MLPKLSPIQPVMDLLCIVVFVILYYSCFTPAGCSLLLYLHYITIETRAPSERSPRPFIPLHAIPKQRFITNRTELLRQITHQQRDVSGKARVHTDRDRAPTPDASAQQSNCECMCVCCQSNRCTHTSGSKSCVAVPVSLLAAVVYSHIRYDTRALWRRKKRTECMTTN